MQLGLAPLERGAPLCEKTGTKPDDDCLRLRREKDEITTRPQPVKSKNVCPGRNVRLDLKELVAT